MEAIFVAKVIDPSKAPYWVSVEAQADANGWKPLEMGDCNPAVVLSADYGPATWTLDDHDPAPGTDTTVLDLLVWEQACSGGLPTTGRMSAVIDDAPDSVTITIGVRPLDLAPGTALDCIGPPGTPVTVTLAEPLGQRTLLDGGHYPAAPPTSH
jgi:hypothetical protein